MPSTLAPGWAASKPRAHLCLGPRYREPCGSRTARGNEGRRVTPQVNERRAGLSPVIWLKGESPTRSAAGSQCHTPAKEAIRIRRLQVEAHNGTPGTQCIQLFGGRWCSLPARQVAHSFPCLPFQDPSIKCLGAGAAGLNFNFGLSERCARRCTY